MSSPTKAAAIVYPDDDGKPMSDNTLQFRWIQVLTGNLLVLYAGRDDVFVGGNLLWYPVEGFPKIRHAPDAFVVLGRPPGYRGSYKQWGEDDVPMTVVFEVRSPNDGNRLMAKKRKFYDEYGVEEYYLLDPQTNTLEVYLRRAGQFAPQRLPGGQYSSPRLGIRFDTTGPEVAVSYPDGRPFLNFDELAAERDRERSRADRAEERSRRLAELFFLTRSGQATADQLAELDRLLKETTGG